MGDRKQALTHMVRALGKRKQFMEGLYGGGRGDPSSFLPRHLEELAVPHSLKMEPAMQVYILA